MKWLVLAFMFVLGMAQGYPLYGSNGAVDCTIFGTFKDPYTPGNVNVYESIILYVDLSLIRSNDNDSSAVEAIYYLTDGNHRVYRMRPEYTRELQSNRWLIGFPVPKEAIARSLTVDPSENPSYGEQFTINLGDVINASNEKVNIFYYGVLSSELVSNRRSIELDIGVNNNDTSRLALSASNFSLLDQWGWRYNSKVYDSYSKKGFRPANLEANQTIRSSLFFSSLSPLSRPTRLIYNYSNDSSIEIDIDVEGGLLANASADQKTKDCCCSGDQSEVENPATLAGSIKASKSRLAKVRENLNTSV